MALDIPSGFSMPELRVISGPSKGANYNIGFGITTLGRAKTNSISINDVEMSRQHAELHVHRGEAILVDLSSANGTRINGLEVSRQPLKTGDQILLGQTLVEYLAQPREDSVRSSLMDTVENGNDESRFEHQSTGSFGETTDELIKTRSNLDVLYQSALAAGSFQNTRNLLQRILDLVFCWISADRACILIRENAMDNWIAKSMDGEIPNGYSTSPFEVNSQVVKHVFQMREGLVISNLSNDDRFSDESNGLIGLKKDIQVICAPIIGRNGMRGVIYADRPITTDTDNPLDPPFDEDQLKMLTAIGLHAAVSIESFEHYAMILQSERVTAVGNAMASLSHHIKNVLQSINGGNHLIEAGLENEKLELIKNGWQIVERNQATLSHLMMDMLLYGKSISDKPEPTQFDEMLRSSVQGCEQMAHSNQVKIVIAPLPDLPLFRIDAELVARAIQNIVAFSVNAYDDSPGVVDISVEFDLEQGATKLAIRDKGPALLASERETLFDPFTLGENTSRFGLGMAVARKILREVGADVKILPTEPQGTEFQILFAKMHLERMPSAEAKTPPL